VLYKLLTTAAAPLVIAGVTLAGCGSGGSDSESATAPNHTGAAPGMNMAAAKATVARYSSRPTEFPASIALKRKPTGKTFAYLQCSTPVCGLFAQLITPTQKLLGYHLKVVKAGASANEVQTAMDSIVSLKPDGVILPAADPNQFLHQMQQLQKAKIPVSANGILDPEKYDIKVDFINNKTDALAGKIMAHWAVTHGGGEVVFYGVPELSFTPLMRQAFDQEMTAVCSSCKVRHVDIPIAAIGKDAPNRVVSDLQSHPSTKTAVFSSAETGTGLPAALRAAQLKVRLMGWGPPPVILGYIKEGQWDAGLGVDGYTMIWAQVDALARMVMGDEPTPSEERGLPALQILTQKDITFDPSKGWQAYPDFAQRFAKLWGAAQ
jgi:ribose transport system substrate-binding protein